MNFKAEAQRFLTWCNTAEPGWRNSPDEINLRFWLMYRSGHGLDSSRNVADIMKAIRNGHEETLTDFDIFGDTEKEGEDMAEKQTRNRDAKGKPAAATLLREVNPKTLQGKILAYILDDLLGSTSVDDVCEQFFLERHGLMTNLNIVAKNCGIGYSVSGDAIKVTLPPGVTDPFEL